MPGDARVVARLRLEDIVGLVFFLGYLALLVFFRELRGEELSPTDVLVIVPAVCLLLAKELVQYFLAGRGTRVESPESFREFARPYWEIVRDWSPFLVVLLMYYSLWGGATHVLVTTDRDKELIGWDQKLFGFQASVALQGIVNPTLTAWMQFAYFFHLLNIPIVACFLYLRRPRARFREMMSGVLVVTFFGLIGYLLVPAIGPIYTLRDKFTVPLSQPFTVLSREAEFMDFARIKRDCFPSLHVGMSFLVWMYAFRNSRRLFWVLCPFVLSLWVSTVYLRLHYLVDVLAGLLLAPLCFALSNFLFHRFGEISLPVPLPANLAQRFRLSSPTQAPEKSVDRIEEHW